MSRSSIAFAALLLTGCTNGKMNFALNTQPDTLSFVSESSTKGKFKRILRRNGSVTIYTGSYWIEGKNCWVYPWHGSAYDGTGFYTTDSGMVNLGMRKNLFGQIRALYVNDDGQEYIRID